MSKGVISALLHALCDVISLQIYEINIISIEERYKSISFWKKHLRSVVAVYGDHQWRIFVEIIGGDESLRH